MLPKHTILTPHPMEMSRLLGIDLSDISHNIFDIANQCSYNNEIVYVLKMLGHLLPLPAKNILIFPEIMEWQPQERRCADRYYCRPYGSESLLL